MSTSQGNGSNQGSQHVPNWSAWSGRSAETGNNSHVGHHHHQQQQQPQQRAFVVQNIGLQLVNNYYEWSNARSAASTTEVAFSQSSQQQMATAGQGFQAYRPGSQFMAGITQSASTTVNANQSNKVIGAKRVLDNPSINNSAQVNAAPPVAKAPRSSTNEEVPIICNFCGRQFGSKQEAYEHLKIFHIINTGRGWAPKTTPVTQSASTPQFSAEVQRISSNEETVTGVISRNDNGNSVNLLASTDQIRQQSIVPSKKAAQGEKSGLLSKQSSLGFAGGGNTTNGSSQPTEDLRLQASHGQDHVQISQLNSSTALSNNADGSCEEFTYSNQQPIFSIFQPSEETQRIKVLSVTSLAEPTIKREEQPNDVEIRDKKASKSAAASRKKPSSAKGKGKKCGTLSAQLSSSSQPANVAQEARKELTELAKEKVKKNVAIKQKRKSTEEGNNKKSKKQKQAEPMLSSIVLPESADQSASIDQSTSVATGENSIVQSHSNSVATLQMITSARESVPGTLSASDPKNVTPPSTIEESQVPTPVLIAETSEEPALEADQTLVVESESVIEVCGMLQSSGVAEEEKDSTSSEIEAQVDDFSTAIDTANDVRSNIDQTFETSEKGLSDERKGLSDERNDGTCDVTEQTATKQSSNKVKGQSSNTVTEQTGTNSNDVSETNFDGIVPKEPSVVESSSENSNREESVINKARGETCASTSNISELNTSEKCSQSVPIDNSNSVNEEPAIAESASELSCLPSENLEQSQNEELTANNAEDSEDNSENSADNAGNFLDNGNVDNGTVPDHVSASVDDGPQNDLGQHKCLHCPDKFDSSLDYLAHLQKKHHGQVSKVLRGAKIFVDQTNNVSLSVASTAKERVGQNVLTRTAPNKCQKCDRHFYTQRSLHSHYIALHVSKSTKTQNVRCNRCGLYLPSPSLFVTHRMQCGWFWSDRSRMYCCKKCGKKYKKKSAVFGHLPRCYLTEKVESFQKKSIRIQKSEGFDQSNDEVSPSSISPDAESGPFTFRFSARVVQKRAIEKQISDFFKDKPADRLGLLKPVLNRNVCSGCGTEFPTFKDLARHLSIERVWNCSLRVSKPFLSQILFESGQHVEPSLCGSPRKQFSEQRNTATIRRLLKSIKDNTDDMSSLLRKMSATEKVSEVTAKILSVIQSNAGRLSESWISDSFETSGISRYYLDCVSIFCQPIMMDFKSVNPVWAQIRSRASFIVKTANEVRVRAFCVGREQRECNQAVNSALQEFVSVFAKQKELTTFEDCARKLLLG